MEKDMGIQEQGHGKDNPDMGKEPVTEVLQLAANSETAETVPANITLECETGKFGLTGEE